MEKLIAVYTFSGKVHPSVSDDDGRYIEIVSLPAGGYIAELNL
jgi:hypothetical protein